MVRRKESIRPYVCVNRIATDKPATTIVLAGETSLFVDVTLASAANDIKEDNAVVFQQEPIGNSCQSSSPEAAQTLAEGLNTNCTAPSGIVTDTSRGLFPQCEQKC